MTIRVSHTLLSTYLVSGTPTSAVSSHDILAVLRPDEPDERVRLDETLFAKLGVLRSVALKVKESAANEHLAISRPGCKGGVEGDGGGWRGKSGVCSERI